MVPGVDGRRDIPDHLRRRESSKRHRRSAKLKSLEQRANDTLWIRDTVVGS